MDQMNDILSGLTSPTTETGANSQSYVDSELHDNREEQRKLEKKLKRARKKGKKGKKLQKKIKKLKKERKQLKAAAQDMMQNPVRGRWDTLIEKSVPEAIKFATAVVNRNKSASQPKRQVVYVPKNQAKSFSPAQSLYLPQSHPVYLPQAQPLYLPIPEDDDK